MSRKHFTLTLRLLLCLNYNPLYKIFVFAKGRRREIARLAELKSIRAINQFSNAELPTNDRFLLICFPFSSKKCIYDEIWKGIFSFIVFAQKFSFRFEKRVQITIHLKFSSKEQFISKAEKKRREKKSGCGVKKCLRLFYDYFPFIIAVGFLAYTIFLKSFIVRLWVCFC